MRSPGLFLRQSARDTNKDSRWQLVFATLPLILRRRSHGSVTTARLQTSTSGKKYTAMPTRSKLSVFYSRSFCLAAVYFVSITRPTFYMNQPSHHGTSLAHRCHVPCVMLTLQTSVDLRRQALFLSFHGGLRAPLGQQCKAANAPIGSAPRPTRSKNVRQTPQAASHLPERLRSRPSSGEPPVQREPASSGTIGPALSCWRVYDKTRLVDSARCE